MGDDMCRYMTVYLVVTLLTTLYKWFWPTLDMCDVI